MDDETKQIAQALYVEQGFTATQVAKKMGIGRTTMYRWLKAGGWEQLQNERMMAPMLIRQYYQRSQKLLKQIESSDVIPPTAEVESLNKLAAVIQKIDLNIDSRLQQKILIDFYAYISKQNPDLAKEIWPAQIRFINEANSKSKKECPPVSDI